MNFASQGIKKLSWQIYSKLSKVPFKHFNSKKNMIEIFYTNLFKDLSSILVSCSHVNLVFYSFHIFQTCTGEGGEVQEVS